MEYVCLLYTSSASYVTVTSSEGASDSVAAEASDEQSAGNDVVAENTSDWSVPNSEGSESTDSAEAESSNAAYAGTSSQDQKMCIRDRSIRPVMCLTLWYTG